MIDKIGRLEIRNHKNHNCYNDDNNNNNNNKNNNNNYNYNYNTIIIIISSVEISQPAQGQDS